MREILFRGKRIDNSEWVEGTLILTTAVEQKPYIVDSCWCPYMKTNERGYADFDWLNAYEVIPETVGQYTGLTDKNGKRIFEGDIISVNHPYNGNSIHEVIWDKYCWNLKNFYASCFDYPSMAFSERTKYMTAVGNIHDSPELLNKEVIQNGG